MPEVAVYVIFLQYNQQYDWPKKNRLTFCPIIFLFSFNIFVQIFCCVFYVTTCISTWIFSYSFHRPKRIISSKHIDRKLVHLLVKFSTFFFQELSSLAWQSCRFPLSDASNELYPHTSPSLTKATGLKCPIQNDPY